MIILYTFILPIKIKRNENRLDKVLFFVFVFDVVLTEITKKKYRK